MQPRGYQTSIIIVNWNGRSWLETCLPALQDQTCQDFEIVVVDNGSADDSAVWLARHWPQVRLLTQSRNTGFAPANNVGIQATTTPYVVTLNNDTIVSPTWLAEMVTAMSEPDVGMVAACIVQWSQPHLLDSAGIEVDRAGIAWQRGWNQTVATATTPADVFGPSAAAALYRRAMLDDIGLFDDDYFAYYEDVDLAWRAQQAGWRCRYAPAAQVQHWHSATAAAMPARKLYLISRNKIWTLLKNYAVASLWTALPAILAYDVLATVYQTGRTRQTAALRGRVDALRYRHLALAKRPSSVPPVPLSPITPPWRLAARTRHI
ncbi:MAG: glycosyltransferase family 2 protein [Anaerolinea sp.]|nr:glycosyltransferase family 2 protein [Anaerolinea sp.]